MPFVIAAEHTQTQILSTQVTVAFARNPLTLAYQANDLQMLSEGRWQEMGALVTLSTG